MWVVKFDQHMGRRVKGPFYFTGKTGNRFSYSHLQGEGHRFSEKEAAETIAGFLNNYGLRLSAQVVPAEFVRDRAPYERGV